jgi:hypothetical protein
MDATPAIKCEYRVVGGKITFWRLHEATESLLAACGDLRRPAANHFGGQIGYAGTGESDPGDRRAIRGECDYTGQWADKRIMTDPESSDFLNMALPSRQKRFERHSRRFDTDGNDGIQSVRCRI